MRFFINIVLFILLVNVVYSQTTYYSKANGNWNNASTWTTAGCGGGVNAGPPTATDNVVICNGNTVTLTANATINNIEVISGSVVNVDKRTLDINGNLTLNGTLYGQGTGNPNININKNGAILDGNGVIDIKDVGGSAFNLNNNAIFLSTASYTIVNRVIIGSNFTITNNGSVYVGILLDGSNAASTWVNAANSYLNVAGSILSTGVLNASASNNTVEYTGNVAQNIKTPSANTYFNLTASNSAAAPSLTQQASLIVSGNFTINIGTYETSTFDLTVGGNFTNYGTFNYNTRTVTLNGTNNQTIINSLGQSFYNFTINKASGDVIISNNVVVRNILNMTSGDINAGSNRITVGYGTAAGQDGTLTYTQGAVIGEYEKYIRASGSYTFPVGTSAYDRPAVANFTMTASGSVIAKFWQSPPGNSGLALVDPSTATWVYNTFSEGYWALTSANGFTTSSYNLDLTGSGFNSFTVDADTRLLIRSNAGSSWIAQGTHVAASGLTAKRTGLTTFSGQYCFGDDTFCARPTTSAITGTASVCINQTGVSYSVTNTPLSLYEWSISPSAAGTVVGNGGNAITIDWGPVGYNATVKVVERNTCTWGDTVYYAVTVSPVAPTSITGQTSVPIGATGRVYSVPNLGYTYTWTVNGGTTDPNPISGQGTSNVTVNWANTVGTGSISVVASNGCGASAPVTMNVRRYIIIKSIANGSWTNTATWDCACVPLSTDNVQISHNVSLPSGSNFTINNVIVDATGTISMSTSNPAKDFYIDGDLILNGSITGSKHDVYLRGANKIIGGTGAFNQSTTLYITGGNKTIESTAVLNVASVDVSIAAGVTVSNNGSFSVSGDNKSLINGGTWVNNANSYLKVCKSIASALNASSNGNTVEYGTNSGVLITVKVPVANSYYNLKISGTGAQWKFLGGNTIIYGDLSIIDDAKLHVSASLYNINIGGNWINTSTNAVAFAEQTASVTFDGSNDQTITCTGLASGELFYNLIINKTAGKIILANSITASNQLTMTSGNIDCGANRLIVGIGTGAAAGTLSHTSGTIIGEYQKWTNGAALYKFPLGTASFYRPFNLTLNSGVTNGSIIAKFVSADPGNSGLSLNDGGINVIDRFNDGYWNFLAANSFACTNLSVDATGTGFTNYTINSATRIIKSDNGAAFTLTGLGTHANGSGSTCYRNNITSGINNAGGTKFCLGHTDCVTFSPPSITGNLNVCSGSTEVYSVPNTGRNYTWTIFGGTTDPNPSAGQGTFQVTVTWNTPRINASVAVVESSGCYTAPSSSITVAIHSLPTNAISGPNSVPDNSLQGPYTVTNRAGYTYTWSIPIGNGSIASGQGTNSVYVNWGNPFTATLRCVGQYTGCAAAANEDYSVTVNSSIVSQASGNWNVAGTWVGGNIPDLTTESARIKSGHNVTLNGNYTINSLYIEGGGTLTHGTTGGGGYDLTIQGGYYNYGNHNLINSNNDVNLTATSAGVLIGGSGGWIDVAGNFNINGNNHTVVAGTDLIFVGNLTLGNSITLNNFGIMTVYGDLLDANNPGSTWINEANSTLNVYGSLLSTRGNIFANSTGNTVAYIGDAAQNIKTPNSNKYWNLTITTDGAVANTKTMQANLDIDGTLRISNNAALSTSGSNYQLNIGADWINTSANANAFTENSGKVIFDGLSNQIINNSLGETFYRIEIASQGDVTLSSGNITVSNLLTLTKGALITGNYRVIIPSGSNTNTGDDDSFVDGYVRRVGNTAYTFPTGDKTTSYYWAPIGISNITSGAGDYFEATFKRTSPPNQASLGAGLDHISQLEYWDITPSNGTATADVTLHWKNAAGSGITDISSGDLAIAHWTGTEWENKNGTIWGGSTVGAGGVGYITANLTSFSPVAHAAKIGINPLPIELLYFKAYKHLSEVIVEWGTSSELNCDKFIVQKSKDFYIIDSFAEALGNGTSNSPHYYSVIDKEPANGISYYRIKQIDIDGNFEYSNWVPIEFNNGLDIQVFPNPVNKGDEFYLKVNSFNNEQTLIVVQDVLGKELFSKVVIVENEESVLFGVDLENNIPPGVYFIIGTSKNQIFNKKIIIK